MSVLYSFCCCNYSRMCKCCSVVVVVVVVVSETVAVVHVSIVQFLLL